MELRVPKPCLIEVKTADALTEEFNDTIDVVAETIVCAIGDYGVCGVCFIRPHKGAISDELADFGGLHAGWRNWAYDSELITERPKVDWQGSGVCEGVAH